MKRSTINVFENYLLTNQYFFIILLVTFGLLGNNDDDLEVLYNDLISGQLVEEDRFKKMKEI